MKKKMKNSKLNNIKSMKKMLKPVIEKKRRDRINESLGELKALLLNYTSDARLQNPKLEKAEILDLAVEYLQKRTNRRILSKDSSSPAQSGPWEVSQGGIPSPQGPKPTALPVIYTAGFQQCVSHLSGFMCSTNPSEREGLIQGLKSYMDNHQYPTNNSARRCLSSSSTDCHLRLSGRTLREVCCHSNQDATPSFDSRLSGFCKHTLPTFQPDGHSYPMSPDYLSPPPSPCLSCSSSAFTTPPPYPSISCHFPFPSSLSPISTNRSSFSHSLTRHPIPAPVGFSPTLLLSSPSNLPLPSMTSVRSPDPTQLFANSIHSMWRPWF